MCSNGSRPLLFPGFLPSTPSFPPPTPTPPPPPPLPLFSSPSSHSFPVLAIFVLGMIATSILLVIYYVFVVKCCLNLHRSDLLRRFSISQARRQDSSVTAYTPEVVSRGLDEAFIRAIPIIEFKKRDVNGENNEMSFIECAVCLNEFQEAEKLRILPNCTHPFHIDCIDIWLQNNANCPLCRSNISGSTQILNDHVISSDVSSSEDPIPFVGGDEDFVVIDLRDEESVPESSGELSEQPINSSPRKLEERSVPNKAKELLHMSSMGDEWIDVRWKGDQFAIQHIRRSFSLDFSADREIYLSVQEIIHQQRNLSEVSTGEGSSSNRLRRKFFSFSQSRGSRNSVLPIKNES